MTDTKLAITLTPERETILRDYAAWESRIYPGDPRAFSELFAEIDRLRSLNDSLLPVVRMAAETEKYTEEQKRELQADYNDWLSKRNPIVGEHVREALDFVADWWKEHKSQSVPETIVRKSPDGRKGFDWLKPGDPRCPSMHGKQQCQWQIGHDGPHQECNEVWNHA